MLAPRCVALVLLTLPLVACTDASPPSRRVIEVGDVALPDHQRFHPVALASEPFSTDTGLGQPVSLLWHDGLLWVVDFAGSPWLHALDPTTGNIRWSGGGSGEGPGQFSFVTNLAGGPEGDRLWAYDANNRRFTAIDTTLHADDTPEIIRSQVVGRINRAVPLADGRFFGMYMVNPDSGEVVVLGHDGSVLREQPWPLLGGDSVPMLQRLFASGASFAVALCPRPDGRRVAVAYSAAGQVDVFGEDGTLVLTAEVPFPTEATFKVGRDGTLHADRPRMWYRDCTATMDRIFALFSGRREQDFEEPEARGAAAFVHAFDWDGKLVATYALDTPLGDIAVDTAGHLLYGVPVGEATIVRFRVP